MSVESIMAGTAFIKMTIDNAELKRGLDNAQGKVQNFIATLNASASKIVMLGRDQIIDQGSETA